MLIGIKNPTEVVKSHVDLDVWTTNSGGGTILEKQVLYNVLTAEAHGSP